MTLTPSRLYPLADALGMELRVEPTHGWEHKLTGTRMAPLHIPAFKLKRELPMVVTDSRVDQRGEAYVLVKVCGALYFLLLGPGGAMGDGLQLLILNGEKLDGPKLMKPTNAWSRKSILKAAQPALVAEYRFDGMNWQVVDHPRDRLALWMALRNVGKTTNQADEEVLTQFGDPLAPADPEPGTFHEFLAKSRDKARHKEAL